MPIMVVQVYTYTHNNINKTAQKQDHKSVWRLFNDNDSYQHSLNLPLHKC